MFNTLEDAPSQRLDGGHIYGKGMWAASLRYHKEQFHVVFVCNDTRKSCHFTVQYAQGPWVRHEMQGFYYDCSLLFDDDGRVYIAHGNKQIRITDMKGDLSGPKEDGLDRLVLVDTGDVKVGFEGTHFYKKNGGYYMIIRAAN